MYALGTSIHLSSDLDKGKVFKAAGKVIRNVLSSAEVQNYCAGIGIRWRFNVPKAPWWGGLFERLVRSTKQCLRKTLRQVKLSYDELLTALVEVEMVLNSRPLTYIFSDDLEETLSPSHLLVGRRLVTFPDHLAVNPDADGDDDIQLNSGGGSGGAGGSRAPPKKALEGLSPSYNKRS